MRVKVEGALTLVMGTTASFKVGKNLAEGAGVVGVDVVGVDVVGVDVVVEKGDWLQHRGSMMMRKGRGKEVKLGKGLRCFRRRILARLGQNGVTTNKEERKWGDARRNDGVA